MEKAKNDVNTVFEDEYLIIVNKPAGVASQCEGSDDIVSRAKKHTGRDVFIINRLDQPVGGLVLLAKDKNTAAALSDLEIEKHYLTVVCGMPKEKDRLENYLFHNKRQNTVKIVNKGMGKLAFLEYKKISQRGTYALLDVRLITGRHHQIRVQMTANGTPIYGDTKYNPEFRHKRGVFPALFSHSLKFIHPVTKEEMYFEAKPDDKVFEVFY